MKILLIDDSPLVRAIFSDTLKEIPYVKEVDTAANGKLGLELISKKSYDLIFLDIEMPTLNGFEFLQKKKAMGNSVPVIMLSSYTQEGAEFTFKALELGAIDFIPKPLGKQNPLGTIKEEIQKKVINFYEEILKKYNKTLIQEIPYKQKPRKKLLDFEVVLIGSSTGGPKILSQIIKKIPKDFPLPIVIIQHMPEYFTEVFAHRLAKESFLEVLEAKDGLELKRGRIIIAKGGKHLIFRKENQKILCELSLEEKLNGVRPSIDKSLFSLIEIFSEKIIGIILTGMGKDGIEALKVLHNMGGLIIAQDEDTSVIFGMNKRAIEENIVDEILPDKRIVDYLLELSEI
ncbi:MAG: chemotaxis-specific protein-glutamate methyltransferase CheB [Leptonema sp. (in: bacteria)]